MLYIFENPSDPYVFAAANRETAALTVLMLGVEYGATPREGDENVPIFIFGGAEEWYEKTFGRTMTEGFAALKGEVAASLESFMYGDFNDWKKYQSALNAIDDPAKRDAFRAEWQDGISSLNDIGGYAHQIGAKIREKSARKQARTKKPPLTEQLNKADAEAKAHNAQRAQNPKNQRKRKSKKEELS
jgi:hypothetical protein